MSRSYQNLWIQQKRLRSKERLQQQQQQQRELIKCEAQILSSPVRGLSQRRPIRRPRSRSTWLAEGR